MAEEDSVAALRALVRDLIDKRRAADKAKEAQVEAYRERDEAEAALFDYQEEHKLPGVDVELGEGYGTYHSKRRATDYARVLNEDALLQWANENARTEELFGPSKVRKKPLNQMVRDAQRLHQRLPDGVDWSTKRGITLTRKDK
jgi:hypothetical protein